MSLLDRIHEANAHDPASFLPFRADGVTVGSVRPAFAGTLARWPEVFDAGSDAVCIHPRLRAPEERTAAVAEVLARLREEGVIAGWRDEFYPVNRSFAEPPALLMERAAIPAFGVCGYGVHMNGYVRRADGLHVWVARRAMTKPTGPGKLDQVVAGGQPHGIGLRENLVKECDEEAGIGAGLAAKARIGSVITYCLETPLGLRPDVIYCYDLDMPEEFTPRNLDGEVESFELWPATQVLETLRESRAFKFNCALVAIDFLVRHGVIGEQEPHYVEIVRGLRATRAPCARLDE
jgi:isopentenyldiphosphate isomerase